VLKRHKYTDTPNARYDVIIIITNQARVVNLCCGGPETTAVMTEIFVNLLRLHMRIYIYIYVCVWGGGGRGRAVA
jgi:hypothetical protein